MSKPDPLIPAAPSVFSQPKRRAILLTGLAAVAVAATLMACKTYAYFHTGSAAILASVFDSGIDLFMSALTFLSLRYSLTPPDKEHRHGHGKIEGITAMIQGALMMSLAGVLAYQAVGRLMAGAQMEDPALGVGAMAVSMALSFILVRIQSSAVQHYHSLAIEADRGHYANDIYMNAGTIGVLVLVPLTGFHFFDPVFALLVAGLMIWTAFGIGRKSFAMLLDEEVEGPMKDEVTALIRTDQRIRDLHDLRVIRSGMRLMVSFDIEVDGMLSLRDAHAIAIHAEDRIVARFPHAEVMIHLDPDGAAPDRRHLYHWGA